MKNNIDNKVALYDTERRKVVAVRWKRLQTVTSPNKIDRQHTQIYF